MNDLSLRNSYAHCQAPRLVSLLREASALTIAWQRVYLSNPEMKGENQIKTSPSLDSKKRVTLFEKRFGNGGYSS